MACDQIFIRDLLVRCIIGIQEWERHTLQDVVIQLELTTDTARAGVSDNIDDAVDYKRLTKKIIAHAEGSACWLVEALAEQIAAICLEHPRVEAARVSVEKPGALRFARTVGVTILRRRTPA
ncbi:Dihydroneopterin triphosphate 2'-epimerase [Candidatus Magnetaquicoccaceae bacterium FCR-1]|uniref:7,8-dihydroneopterin aldolase n=1 Tax=Candidatus Magnetaquiglobus chichijimensis TaxID=3141448 RepID=A0ABQ0C4L7_9PROT